MIGPMMKKPDITLILDSRKAKEEPKEDEAPTKSEPQTEKSKAVKMACKEFFMAGQAGSYDKAVSALEALLDLMAMPEEDEEDDE